MNDVVDIARVTLFGINACKCTNLESCFCDKSRKVPMKEQNFLQDQRNDKSLFIGKLDQEETGRLAKNIKRKEIEKQIAILAAQKTSYDENEFLGDEVEEEMEHLAKDVLSYEVNRNSEAEASRQSTSENPSSSSQMRKGLKLFAQTCDKFQIRDRAASVLCSAILCDLEIVTPEKTQMLIDKSKVRRERFKQRRAFQSSDCALASKPMQGLYFDSRKDKTLIQVTELDGKRH